MAIQDRTWRAFLSLTGCGLLVTIGWVAWAGDESSRQRRIAHFESLLHEQQAVRAVMANCTERAGTDADAETKTETEALRKREATLAARTERLRRSLFQPHRDLASLPLPPAGTPVDVVKVEDGDTIIIRSPGTRWVYDKVRLVGVDTPEKPPVYRWNVSKRRRHIAWYGRTIVSSKHAWEAGRDALAAMLRLGTVVLDYHHGNPLRDFTKSHRILAYITVKGPGYEFDVNGMLCRLGYSYDYSRRYPHPRGAAYRASIEAAKREHLGYWAAAWRSPTPRTTATGSRR